MKKRRGGRGRVRYRSRVGGWAIAAVLAVIAILLYEIRYALLPFVFAIAVGFVTDPLIRALQKRLRSPRWPVAIALYVVLLAVLGGAGYWIGSLAIADLTKFLATAPQKISHLLNEVVGSKGIDVFGKTYRADQIAAEIGGAFEGMLGANALKEAAGYAISLIFGGFLLLVLTPYFMVSGPRLAKGSIWLLPPERRHSVEVLLPTLVPALRRYLIGICLVVLYTSLVAWIGFGVVFHLQHAVLLAITVGLLELIPVVGPLASASLVGLTAIEQSSLWEMALLVAFAIGLRLSIDNIIGPLVLGKAARIHPVVVIISFVCGAMLFGVVGLLLAVPAVVCVKTALEHYYVEPIAESGTPT
ncbi:MAG TPA: AI-2E family transporter [Stellaceae bacterium]|nr:AI-2E family transporter [Stellaceae bacterium]